MLKQNLDKLIKKRRDKEILKQVRRTLDVASLSRLSYITYVRYHEEFIDDLRFSTAVVKLNSEIFPRYGRPEAFAGLDDETALAVLRFCEQLYHIP